MIEEKEYVIIIFKVQKKDYLHPGGIYYWVTESNKIDLDKTIEFSPLFLNLFYSSNSYENCCKGDSSIFYSFQNNSKFEFDESFERKQDEFKKYIKQNSRKIQTIKKRNKNNKLLNENITISATAIKAKLCNCKIEDKMHFESVYLPSSELKLNQEFWKSDEAFFILNMDYSKMLYNY